MGLAGSHRLVVDQFGQQVVGVLLVDADDTIARTLEAALRGARSRKYVMSVRRVGSVAEAWSALAASPPDVVVLRLELPDADGLLLCSDLRAHLDVPLLTYGESHRDRILSLRLGADDSVPPPRSPVERETLTERVTALLRHSQNVASLRARTPLRQRVGALQLDAVSGRATYGDRDLRLTPTESRLLSLLMASVDRPVTRAQLARALAEATELAGSRALDMHVRRLRAKLQEHPGGPTISAVRSVGYRLIENPRDLARRSLSSRPPLPRTAPTSKSA